MSYSLIPGISGGLSLLCLFVASWLVSLGRENPNEIWGCLDLFGSSLGQKISALAVMFRSLGCFVLM